MVVTSAREDLGYMDGATSADGSATGDTMVDVGLNDYFIQGLIGSTVIINPIDPTKRDEVRVIGAGSGVLLFEEPYRLGQIVSGTPYIILVTRSADMDAAAANRKLGAFKTKTTLKTVSEILGNPLVDFTVKIDQLLSRAATAATKLSQVPITIEKPDGSCPLGDDNLFIIAGGPIKVVDFFGLVATIIGNNVSTCTIQHACTYPAADIALSTAVAINTDDVGTMYYISSAALGVFTPITAGSFIKPTQMLPWILTPGTLQATFSAANTGLIRWFLQYEPMSELSIVTVAP